MTCTHEEMLERMGRFPERVIRLIEHESLDDLRRAGPGGSWGAVEHVAHLRDFDDVSLDRIDQILSDNAPELDLFDTDVRAIERDYHAQNPLETAEEFRRVRSKLVNRLDGLKDEDWHRTARISGRAPITLETLIRQLDEHDAEHFSALRDVLI
ncbi:MAG TPA: DinB family protein [Nitrolancea sp.]|nr:DinB family protein [Nitrolancea sp.]